MKSIRCAIYTRKSSEEGLEQDFNSLDAQYLACSAYVASQASEGWSLLSQRYDDGGISGGTLERPALQRLLADIAAGRIDIVVVYKVDRLTRSLLDFSKLVEALDKAGTSFVSITQSFNTTTSMGRLTLNMLLSFAQFEREVTAERIRDKVAASKARGMWMGGRPPLGYEPHGRTLIIVDEHAELVRHIFRRYLELGTVRNLCDELRRSGMTKPVRLSRSGKAHGGSAFGRGELSALLCNPIYIGRIRHKDAVHQGLHPAIIEAPLWEAVQVQLGENRTGNQHIRSAVHRNLLAGKLFDNRGQPLLASHASKGVQRYRYYVSRDLQRSDDAPGDGLRIPAGEIEKLVCARLAALFDDPMALMEQLALAAPSPNSIPTIVAACRETARDLRAPDHTAIADLTDAIIHKIDITRDSVAIVLNQHNIAARLRIDPPSTEASASVIAIPVTLKRSGVALRMVLPSGESASSQIDYKLLKSIAIAKQWWQQLLANPHLRIADLAAMHQVTESWVTRVLRLAFLDPAIVLHLMAGTAPAALDFDALRGPEALPALWSKQRDLHQVNVAR